MEKETIYKVHEYDFVKCQRLKLVLTTPDIEKARKKAREITAQWCEDETGTFYTYGAGTKDNPTYLTCENDSDFGALIEFNQEVKKPRVLEQRTIVRNPDGNNRRKVKLSQIQIPDLWHIASNLRSEGQDEAAEMILEVWHLAHDLKWNLCLDEFEKVHK